MERGFENDGCDEGNLKTLWIGVCEWMWRYFFGW